MVSPPLRRLLTRISSDVVRAVSDGVPVGSDADELREGAQRLAARDGGSEPSPVPASSGAPANGLGTLALR